MIITKEMAENLLKFYDANEEEIYYSFTQTLNPVETVDLINKLFKDRHSITCDQYIASQLKSGAANFVFAFFIGAASAMLIKEKEKE